MLDHLLKAGPADPYSLEEASAMLRDHEGRLQELEPILPVIAATEKTWKLLKVAIPVLVALLATNVQQGTLLWRILHALVPFLY